MAESIREVMTRDPRTVEIDDPVIDAARIMRDDDVGAVVVMEQDQLAGIVTDRDIVVRAVAEGRDPSQTKVSEICSRDVTTLSSEDSIKDAIKTMREHDVRRLPVTENGRPVGIVSLGDLAIARDPESVLADISAAPPNQ